MAGVTFDWTVNPTTILAVGALLVGGVSTLTALRGDVDRQRERIDKIELSVAQVSVLGQSVAQLGAQMQAFTQMVQVIRDDNKTNAAAQLDSQRRLYDQLNTMRADLTKLIIKSGSGSTP